MQFPNYRPRRLRRSEKLRSLVRETSLEVNDLIMPLFVRPGKGIKNEITSMKGNYQMSVDVLVKEVKELEGLGIPGVILFGIPEEKDQKASGAYDEEGIVQRAIRAIKGEAKDILVITDVCLCEYTDHGHCGHVMQDRTGRWDVDNDTTLELLAKTALSHAQAGADIVAPSDMMDGRVGAIRGVLDEAGFQDIPIMSYAVKYASAFYSPFREAAESPPKFGDRRTYQMDPPNTREALKEAAMDIQEGADIVMVKPALPYLDIIKTIKETFDCPVAAYNVSGEYSMVKAAAELGWMDGKQVALEILTSIKRAGADIILTYWAKQAAVWLKETQKI
ncbi:MAG: porphobilinogen synthase [Candidatus Brocadiaceae bacterium]|nr:porphobilinogen synthase [Candidatus Brocadiaceae bacterium]